MTPEEKRLAAIKKQEAVRDNLGSAHVVACPGAGKTRVLTDRFLRLASQMAPRHGVAVLSFTNAAVDEFRSRCNVISPGSLCFPHYAGTFDGFINQFIIHAVGIPGCSARPRFVESWDEITVTHGVRGEAATPIPLSKFDARSGSATPEALASWKFKSALASRRSEYEAQARRKRRSLRNSGLLASDDCRVVVAEILADKLKAEALATALTGRFQEIIVDEAQDCNADDTATLEWLHTAGVKLTLVFDPEQAIYEFRKGGVGAIGPLINRLPRLDMDGNFRSSQKICEVAGSIRKSKAVDIAVGDLAEYHAAVHIISYPDKPTVEIGGRFLVAAQAHGVSVGNCMILAHKHRVAEAASGNGSADGTLGSRLVQFVALIVDGQRHGASPKQRERVLKKMVMWIKEMEGQSYEAAISGPAPIYAESQEREYRRKAYELLSCLPSTCSKEGCEEWLEKARTAVEATIVLPAGKSIKQALPAPNGWDRLLRQSAKPTVINCATVHEAKGQQYEAVCVVLEEDTSSLLEDWASRASDTSEALRVLYVAVTRAMRFLSLAVPANHVARVQAILTAANVAYTA